MTESLASHPRILFDLDDFPDFDRLTNPVIDDVRAESPELFAGWTDAEWDQLYSTFGVGGALRAEGVREAASQIQRQRETVGRLQIVLETHLRDVAEELIGALFRLVQVSLPTPRGQSGWQPPPRNPRPGLDPRTPETRYDPDAE